MKKILIIEDDDAILEGLKEALTVEHFDVVSAQDGLRGYEMAKKGNHDLILLDLMLPNLNGTEICKRLRADRISVPIIMLTSKKQEVDKVTGLELGADDYVTKPFSLRELVARIHAVLRRNDRAVSDLDEIAFGDVHVDFKKQEARKARKAVEMSAKEFHLLKYFAQHEGEVITRAMLLDDVWGYDAMPTTRTVDNYVLALRKKLESTPSKPKHFLTIHTAGYKFVS
ncbi:MAG: response regulator transcription factor [Ignavibacteriales bacterium]|nr:response regulator transcription factor [Ignavibacteriales bacterium]